MTNIYNLFASGILVFPVQFVLPMACNVRTRGDLKRKKVKLRRRFTKRKIVGAGRHPHYTLARMPNQGIILFFSWEDGIRCAAAE